MWFNGVHNKICYMELMISAERGIRSAESRNLGTRPRTRFVPISASGLNRCHGNRDKFTAFGHEIVQFSCGYDVPFNEQFHLIGGFISLFLDNTHFCYEIRRRFSSTCGSIIRAHGTCRSKQLSSNNVTRTCARQFVYQAHDSQCKCFRPLLQILVFHVGDFY